jgi:hypothetical protein
MCLHNQRISTCMTAAAVEVYRCTPSEQSGNRCRIRSEYSGNRCKIRAGSSGVLGELQSVKMLRVWRRRQWRNIYTLNKQSGKGCYGRPAAAVAGALPSEQSGNIRANSLG